MKSLHLFLALGLFASIGCSHQPPPQQTLSVSNPNYKIDLLFKDDTGTAIYRFYDQGDYRYYAVGPNGSAQMLPSTRTVTQSYYGPGPAFFYPVPAEHHHH